MGCDDNSSRGRDYEGENEAHEMRKTVREMNLLIFTVGELELIQKLLGDLDFHKQEEGMEKMRRIINKPNRPSERLIMPE